MHLLKRLDQRTAALERRRRRTVSNERRKDIREKIALGGLIVRAGLREADRAYLLGVLLNAATLVVGSREYVRLKTAGALAFRDAPADIKDTRSPRTPTSENGDKASGE
ncbi:conjugal transfer protein TraD [Brucella pseudogrignonensis]|uniref:conjugal transfer protein TraD n=1 Tax=Brucella pseudogrignonensis TaxID=419475 RepID=UPI001F3AEE91|nr:conjugal transfer protein TraD [Brucella pseudogrignonensis]